MEFIAKYELTDTNATSNIPYPDTASGEVLWTAGTYPQGTQRVQNGKIYEVLPSAGTSDTIDEGLVKTPATWFLVAPANFYKPLFNGDDTALTYADSIQYSVTSPTIMSAVALFGVGGESVTVTVNNTNIDPVNPIYEVTQDATDNSDVFDWVSYWTLPSNAKETFYFNDLPSFINSDVTVTINAPSATARLENLIMGELVDAGTTLSGMAPRLRSTSRFVETAFGRTQISNSSVRELETVVKYPTTKHDYLYRRVEQMNDVDTAWAGSSKFSTSVVLGVAEANFSVTNLTQSDATYYIKRYISNVN